MHLTIINILTAILSIQMKLESMIVVSDPITNNNELLIIHKIRVIIMPVVLTYENVENYVSNNDVESTEVN